MLLDVLKVRSGDCDEGSRVRDPMQPVAREAPSFDGQERFVDTSTRAACDGGPAPQNSWRLR